MARRTGCRPSVAGDFQRPARSTPFEDKRRHLQETDELANIISPRISPSELPHTPYPNDTTSLHWIASPDSSTTSHSSPNPFSFGFQGIGLGQVPVSSYDTYYVADYTNTPITNCNPMQNMTPFCAVTADNVEGAYTGRVTVPKAVNVHTSGTNKGKNPVTSKLSRGIPMPQAQRRRGRWQDEEHRKFLQGVEVCGWGKWKLIAKEFVTTRDESQICSHAQKCRSRLDDSSSSKKTPRKNRVPIHDTALEDEFGKVPPQPVPSCNKGDGPAMRPPPLPLPEDSRDWMPLPLNQPPPPPGRGGDTDLASIHPVLMLGSFDVGSLTENDLGEMLDQFSGFLPTNSLLNGRG